MIKKQKFIRLIKVFMVQAGLLEKAATFDDVLYSPEEYFLDDVQVESMRDIISFINGLYFSSSDILRDALVDIFTGGENKQKEYLGFVMDLGDDRESIAELFDIFLKKLFIFSKEALRDTSEDSVTVFLNTLKKELES